MFHLNISLYVLLAIAWIDYGIGLRNIANVTQENVSQKIDEYVPYDCANKCRHGSCRSVTVMDLTKNTNHSDFLCDCEKNGIGSRTSERTSMRILLLFVFFQVCLFFQFFFNQKLFLIFFGNVVKIKKKI